MEHQEAQRQKGLAQPEQETPPSLLSGVLDRLERRQHYLTARPSLQELLLDLEDSRWELRSAAVRALGELGTQVPSEPLIMALGDEHRLVRVTALRALALRGEQLPLEHVILALQDREPEVREMAVYILGERPSQLLKPLLRAALQDSHASVREAAQAALEAYIAPTLETQRPSLKQAAIHLWLVLSRQRLLIHKSTWLATALVIALGGVLYLISNYLYQSTSATEASWFLTLTILAASASGAACIYGNENDPATELQISTPTSLRIVLLYRLVLVLGYNIALAALASGIIALLNGGGFWQITQLWLEPLVFLSSLSLLLSVIIGSLFAVQAALLLEAVQALSIFVAKYTSIIHIERFLALLHILDFSSWHANPIVLLLALLCIVTAVLYAPYQPHLSR